MRDLAPSVFRKRLLVEGIYGRLQVSERTVEEYLYHIVNKLDLTAYGDPIVYDTDNAGMGKSINQGFEGFIPLVESGITLHTWKEARFYSTIIFSCKEFSEEEAIDAIGEFFESEAVEASTF